MKTKNESKTWKAITAMVVALCIGITACSDAQEQELIMTKNGEQVFTKVDQMPEYPGGFAALGQFIGNNLTYPKSEESRGTEGTVHVAFVVDETGKVTDISIEKGVSTALDDAAKNIVGQLPNWTPGEKDGKKVKVKMVLPIKFEMGE